MKKLLLLLICQPIILSIFCQHSIISFEHLLVQQGLAGHESGFIIQDHDGFVWIAGLNDIYRHTRYEFIIFKDQKNSYAMLENGLGLLWLYLPALNIMIHPPFWRTKLAFIIYIVLFLMLLRGYIYWRTKQLRKEKTVLEKQVNERTDELLQQKEELQSTLENLKKTQEQLIESEKMAALGGLVAGIAHEINTPVGIGVTAASSLQEEIHKMAALYKNNEISHKDFREFLESADSAALLIHKNLERTASLIQSFKLVSVDQISEQQRVFNFKSYVEDIIRSLSPKFKQQEITFSIECDERLELNSFPGAYAQIFTNLLLNSFAHGFKEKQRGTIAIHAYLRDNKLTLEYHDDGAGISRKDLPHIFEPFFTSDQQRGTGLGLNIVYNLVRQKLHGNISCTSTPGEGVLFKIDIPVMHKIQIHGEQS